MLKILRVSTKMPPILSSGVDTTVNVKLGYRSSEEHELLDSILAIWQHVEAGLALADHQNELERACLLAMRAAKSESEQKHWRDLLNTLRGIKS